MDWWDSYAILKSNLIQANYSKFHAGIFPSEILQLVKSDLFQFSNHFNLTRQVFFTPPNLQQSSWERCRGKFLLPTVQPKIIYPKYCTQTTCITLTWYLPIQPFWAAATLKAKGQKKFFYTNFYHHFKAKNGNFKS